MTASVVEQRLRAASPNGLVAYVTAGFPSIPAFIDQLHRIADVADTVEVGIPFTDPMADGPVLQQAARAALDAGFRLETLFSELAGTKFNAPLLVMSYLNPLLAMGDRLVPSLVEAGISGLIVPDLPLEEGQGLDAQLKEADLAWVQLIAPTTPGPRARQLAAASRGFVYAITGRGTTGGDATLSDALAGRLADLRAAASVPVLAGFGVRRRAQVEALAPHADGVIVGSALMDAVMKNQDPVQFLKALRAEEITR